MVKTAIYVIISCAFSLLQFHSKTNHVRNDLTEKTSFVCFFFLTVEYIAFELSVSNSFFTALPYFYVLEGRGTYFQTRYDMTEVLEEKVS